MPRIIVKYAMVTSSSSGASVRRALPVTGGSSERPHKIQRQPHRGGNEEAVEAPPEAHDYRVLRSAQAAVAAPKARTAMASMIWPMLHPGGSPCGAYGRCANAGKCASRTDPCVP